MRSPRRSPDAALATSPTSPAAAAAVSRQLPRGWLDLFRQLLIWFGFVFAYQIARGIADQNDAAAFSNARGIVDLERRATGLWELSLQSWAESSHSVAVSMQWTYWLSQFAVVGVSLLWVYFRHHDRFADFRNWLIGANLLGLVGYVLMPTAPPRMFPEWGFTDTLADLSGVNQQSVAFAANPYAAMPSLHAMDALIVGLVMAFVCRSRVAKILWLVWPAWVSFAVMGTGNHFWLDCVAGFLLAIVTGVILFRGRLRQFVPGL